MPPHVLVAFVVFPPGHGKTVTDFWGWYAHEARWRPDDVSVVPGGPLNLNSTNLPRSWSPRESSPSRKIPTIVSVLLGWSGIRVASASSNLTTHRTKNNTTNVVIQQNSRKLLMMDILMSETCWAHKKWNKIASDIKLVFYSSTSTVIPRLTIDPANEFFG